MQIPNRNKAWFALTDPPEYRNNTEFYFYIRGHVRNSFQTERLKNFINLVISNFPNVKFVLQTWNTSECNRGESWRKNIQIKQKIINKSTIDLYFDNPKITSNVLIIDPNTIEYVGDVNGTVCKSCCPKKGWKNMWYGLYKGIKQIPQLNKHMSVVSFRFDYFDIPKTQQVRDHFNEKTIIKFINNNLNRQDIKFIKRNNTIGVDNIYMGSVNNIEKLIEKFHFELENIVNLYPETKNQECLVPKLSNSMNK